MFNDPLTHGLGLLDESPVFRLAVESSPVGMLVCDEDGFILSVNRQVEGMLGYGARELIGRSVNDLLPAANVASHPDSSPVGARRSVTGRRKDGSEVPVEVGLTALFSDERRLVVASIIDISERIEPQGELVRTAEDGVGFERLISNLAARFVSVESDKLHETIVDALRQIGELLDLDRSTWWVFDTSSKDAVAAHSWTREEYRVIKSGESIQQTIPWMLAELQKGEPVFYNRLEDVPSQRDREGFRRFGQKSGIAIPFVSNGAVTAVLGFSTVRREREWSPEVIARFRVVCAVFGHALARKESEERLKVALAEVQELRDRLTSENVRLRREVKGLRVPEIVVAESAATKRVLEQIEAVAPTNATVLLLGETGTGKEVFAQAIHRASDRHRRPMVTVNCGAIPSALIESELFGRERGAFTGSLARQIGRFELAHGSTIFLDEIGELPFESQVKLLRVLQERVVERLGSTEPIKVDVRVIAATNRDLEKAVQERTFREDLFYRLNVFPLTIPPLRERLEDIPALVWSFIEEFSSSFNRPIDSIARESLVALQGRAWPGNVRELRNVIERAIIVAKGPRLVIDLPPSTARSPQSHTLADLEAQEIRKVLESVGWRVRGPGGAAELLGIKPNTLDSRMARLGIQRPRP